MRAKWLLSLSLSEQLVVVAGKIERICREAANREGIYISRKTESSRHPSERKLICGRAHSDVYYISLHEAQALLTLASRAAESTCLNKSHSLSPLVLVFPSRALENLETILIIDKMARFCSLCVCIYTCIYSIAHLQHTESSSLARACISALAALICGIATIIIRALAQANTSESDLKLSSSSGYIVRSHSETHTRLHLRFHDFPLPLTHTHTLLRQYFSATISQWQIQREPLHQPAISAENFSILSLCFLCCKRLLQCVII